MRDHRDPFTREALQFFIRCSINNGLSASEALRRYRAAGWRVSDARFRTVWKLQRENMMLPSRAPLRARYDGQVAVHDKEWK